MDLEAGSYARTWLARCIASRGGIFQLAKLAGLSRVWAHNSQKLLTTGNMPVPRARTVQRVAAVCPEQADVLDDVLTDVSNFWAVLQDGNREIATCRMCGGQMPAWLAKARYHGSTPYPCGPYEASRRTFIHSRCLSRITKVCPGCGKRRPTRRCDLRAHEKRYDVVFQEQQTGEFLVRCVKCSWKLAQRARLEDIIGACILRINQSPRSDWSAGEERLHDYLASKHVKLYDAAAHLLQHEQHRDIAPLLALLKTEGLLRAIGQGDLDRGRTKRNEVVAAARAKHPGGAAASRSRVLTARLSGDFWLCALCHLVVYRERGYRKAQVQLWHRACFIAWLKTDYVKHWRAQRHSAQERGVSLAVLPDFPRPPSPPRIAKETLGGGYQALMAVARGLPQDEIARDSGVTRQAVKQRLDALQDRLPATWDLVFPDRTVTANAARQELVQLPLKAAGLAAVAERMVALGIPSDVIARVTGVKL
jgi:hypothetical protein